MGQVNRDFSTEPRSFVEGMTGNWASARAEAPARSPLQQLLAGDAGLRHGVGVQNFVQGRLVQQALLQNEPAAPAHRVSMARLATSAAFS